MTDVSKAKAFESTMILVSSMRDYGIRHPRDAETYLLYIMRAHEFLIAKLREQAVPTQVDIWNATALRREYRLYSAKLANTM
jgi:hypothetical protein